VKEKWGWREGEREGKRIERSKFLHSRFKFSDGILYLSTYINSFICENQCTFHTIQQSTVLHNPTSLPIEIRPSHFTPNVISAQLKWTKERERKMKKLRMSTNVLEKLLEMACRVCEGGGGFVQLMHNCRTQYKYTHTHTTAHNSFI